MDNGSGATGLGYLKFNRVDSVVTPAAKVMFWERMDFSQQRRNTNIIGIVDRPPQFNNAGAKPQVAATDGSVKKANMAAITQLAYGTPDQQAVFRPSGLWTLGTQFLQFCGYQDAAGNATDNFEIETANGAFQGNSISWYSYFWATRNGVQGRDLP